MKTEKNILAIIPARSGSKRLPGKNIKYFNGKPLIAHTIDTAIQSNCFTKVFVSTDSREIADIALRYKAEAPWLRAPALATDTIDVMDTIIELIKKLESMGEFYDSIMLLQPTSPFRTVQNIHNAVNLHEFSGANVVSVNKSKFKPEWFKQLKEDQRLCSFIETKERNIDTYQLNGSIYLASIHNLLTQKSFYNDNTRGLVIKDEFETIDIDTPMDWAFAEYIAKLMPVMA